MKKKRAKRRIGVRESEWSQELLRGLRLGKTEESQLSRWMTILDSGEGLSGIKQKQNLRHD